MIPRFCATRRVVAVACAPVVILGAIGMLAQAQPLRLDLANTWSSSELGAVLNYVKNQYGAEVAPEASEGIVMAPVRVAPSLAGKLPEHGVVVGFLTTSGTYASPGRYELPRGTYAVVLRPRASGPSVEFRNQDRVIVDRSPVVESLTRTAKTPSVDLTSGRPCYTIDSRRICP
jgi:hypothetical protein